MYLKRLTSRADTDRIMDTQVSTCVDWESFVGDLAAVSEVGMSGATVVKVLGVKVSDTPGGLAGDRGLHGGYLYADGELGDTVLVEDEQGRTDCIPPKYLICLSGLVNSSY